MDGIFSSSAIIGIALWALIPGFIAKSKGRSFAAYYFLSFLISPLITMIIAICVSRRNIISSSGDISEEKRKRLHDIAMEKEKEGIYYWTCPVCSHSNPYRVNICASCKTERIDDEVSNPS